MVGDRKGRGVPIVTVGRHVVVDVDLGGIGSFPSGGADAKGAAVAVAVAVLDAIMAAVSNAAIRIGQGHDTASSFIVSLIDIVEETTRCFLSTGVLLYWANLFNTRDY